MSHFNEFNDSYSSIQYAVGFIYKEGTSEEAGYTLSKTNLKKENFKTLKGMTKETDLYNNKDDVITLIENYKNNIQSVTDDENGAFSDFLKTIHNGQAPVRFVRQQVRNMKFITVQVEYDKSVKPVYK